MNIALNSSSDGFVLSLCQNTQYLIQSPIYFAAPNQEISTVGYPSGEERAILVVSGPVFNGSGHTTAVDGTCPNCNGVKLRNIQVTFIGFSETERLCPDIYHQINGTRGGASPTNGGANIEMGGANSGQLIEYVHSFDPRSWSCLHIAEGSLNCNNVIVQNNDIGPCGSDVFQEWADGISVSCRSAIVRNNMIKNPTDGGIVLFGSPGTLVENNTIWILNVSHARVSFFVTLTISQNTLLGGINMVDVLPFGGDYSGVVVQNNTIIGGLATDSDSDEQSKGENIDDVIIKYVSPMFIDVALLTVLYRIGIAIGPHTWFGDEFGANRSSSGIVRNNILTGAFGYGMAITSATNFTVENNTLVGNTSFIGSRGPNCSTTDVTPTPAPFVIDPVNVTSSTIQNNFQDIPDGNGLTCILPPDGGDYWPYGGNPSSPSPSSSTTTSSNGLSGGAKAGLAIGIILAVLAIAALTYYIRRWALQKQALRAANGRAGYVQERASY